MEEYLQNLRSLRSQINDIEEVAAKRSVEEERQKTAIDALEKDIFSVASETTRLNTESEELEKERTQICHLIFEKQKKISSLENETSTLSQREEKYKKSRGRGDMGSGVQIFGAHIRLTNLGDDQSISDPIRIASYRSCVASPNWPRLYYGAYLESLELLRQQTVSASAGLEEKRLYFAKIMEDLVFKLQQGHDWLNSYKQKITTANLVKEHASTSSEMNLENMRYKMSYKKLIAQVESKKTEYEELKARKFELHDENAKSKQLMVLLEQKTETFTPALKALDMEALQEEHKALLSDEAGELEYLKSLEDQIKQMKSVSHAVKCQCGEEYMV